jgi:2-dehydropantoate 2-reductase
VVGGVVHASICRTAPGCIRIDGIDKLILGEPSGELSVRVRQLCELFTQAGVNAIASDNIRLAIWSKLWGNMNMNPISALTRATTTQLLSDPSTRALCLRMMQEMAQAGERIGLPFTMTAAERIDVTLKLGGFKTSMLNDLEAGLPLEYAPMLGGVVEVAQRLGVPAPCCETVLALVSLLSQSTSATHRPEAGAR